jgi:hypothetical protein
VTAREVLDGIKARIERLDYVRENGSSDWLHASAATDLTALTAAVEAVLAVVDSMDRIADFNLSVLPSDDMGISLRQHAEDIRTLIENALKESQ